MGVGGTRTIPIASRIAYSHYSGRLWLSVSRTRVFHARVFRMQVFNHFDEFYGNWFVVFEPAKIA